MAASDFQINARVRSVLARHWIDTYRLKIGAFRGAVRLSGELHLIRKDSGRPFDGSQLEKILAEIRAVPGVLRVHVDLANWRKDESGKLLPLAKDTSRTGPPGVRTAHVTDVK